MAGRSLPRESLRKCLSALWTRMILEVSQEKPRHSCLRPLAGRPLDLGPEVLKSLLLQERWPAQEASRLGVYISVVCRLAVNWLQNSKHVPCLFGKLGDLLCPMSNPFACQGTSPLGFLVPINLWDLIPLPNRHGVTSKKQNHKHCATPRKSPRSPAVLGRSKASGASGMGRHSALAPMLCPLTFLWDNIPFRSRRPICQWAAPVCRNI